MSRSVAITLSSDLGTDVRAHVKPILEEAFHRSNNKGANLTEDSLKDAVETALVQAQKSLKERHNLLWEYENQRVLLLSKEELEDVSEEEADEAVSQVEQILEDSSKISGKSLVSVLANIKFLSSQS